MVCPPGRPSLETAIVTPTIIIHDLPQAEAALAGADAAGRAVELRSAPGAASTIGPSVFREITNAALAAYPGTGSVAVLDCGDEAGTAMAALRAGCRNLAINVPDDVGAKLRALAEQSGARLHGTTGGGALDLDGAADAAAAVRAYLAREPADG